MSFVCFGCWSDDGSLIIDWIALSGVYGGLVLSDLLQPTTTRFRPPSSLGSNNWQQCFFWIISKSDRLTWAFLSDTSLWMLWQRRAFVDDHPNVKQVSEHKNFLVFFLRYSFKMTSLLWRYHRCLSLTRLKRFLFLTINVHVELPQGEWWSYLEHSSPKMNVEAMC